MDNISSPSLGSTIVTIQWRIEETSWALCTAWTKGSSSSGTVIVCSPPSALSLYSKFFPNLLTVLRNLRIDHDLKNRGHTTLWFDNVLGVEEQCRAFTTLMAG